MKQFLLGAVAVIGLLAVQPARASHIHYSDVRINGVALDSTGGQTNPTFNLSAGDSLTFTASVAGDSADLFFGFLSGFPGATPDNFDFSYSGSGSDTWTESFVFGNLGSFTGTINLASTNSCPDYIGPNGEGGAGCGSTTPFGFSVNVASTAVPEPASLVLLGAGLLGLTGLRRKRARNLA